MSSEDGILYACTWKLFPHARMVAPFLFASMDEAADAKDHGPNIKLLGRWATDRCTEGVLFMRAKTSKDAQAFASNWASACEVKVNPVCTDDQAREIVLTKKPDFVTDDIMANPQNFDGLKDGESLYWISYAPLGNTSEAKMSFMKAMELLDSREKLEGNFKACNIRPVCMFHNLGNSTGNGIFAAQSETSIMGWLHGWTGLFDMTIKPVCDTPETRAYVAGHPDFQKNLQGALKAVEQATVIPHKAVPPFA